MDGAERILDEQVVAVGQLARELRVVGGLPRVEARVLEHRELAVEQLPQPLLDGLHRVRGVRALRPAEVRADRDGGGRAVAEQLERRQRGADAGVVRHASVLERHVQIGANEDAAAFDLRVAHGARVPHSSIGIEL